MAVGPAPVSLAAYADAGAVTVTALAFLFALLLGIARSRPSRTSNSRPPVLTFMPLAVAPRAPKWRQWFGVDIKRK